MDQGTQQQATEQNVQPISEPEIEDINASALFFVRTKYRGWAILLLFIAVVLTILIALSAVKSEDNLNSINLLVFPIMLTVFAFRLIQRSIEHDFFKQFAARHGLIYTEQSATLDIYSSYLLQCGHNQYLSDIVSGVYNNQPIRVFEFNTTIGYGKGAHHYAVTVVECSDLGDVPDLYIRKKNISFFDDYMYDPISAMKQLNLEGDFDNYFKVFIEGGYEIEALEILTPDVMQELLAVSKNYNFEFNKNKLYIFTAGRVVTKKDELDAMFEFSETLITKLAPVLATIKTTAVEK